jgi:hypothetical protein
VRGQNVAAGAVLVKIDNPETIVKRAQSIAAKVVAEAQLANIHAGTRAEVIAARKAEQGRAEANVVLAQKTFDRTRQLTEHGNAPVARLDQATDSLHESQRTLDQAKSAYEQAINGYTREEMLGMTPMDLFSADRATLERDYDAIIADAGAYADFLLARPEVSGSAIGTTGYCLGGRMSLIAAGGLGRTIAAAASFHGGRVAVADDPSSPHLSADRITAAVYVAGAIEDGSFTTEQAGLLDSALTGAGVEHTVEFYPAHHGFAVPDNPT